MVPGKEREPDRLLYDTNKSVRAKIDKIMEEAVMLYANCNTGSSKDCGSREKAARLEKKILKKIKDLDERFYNDRLYMGK